MEGFDLGDKLFDRIQKLVKLVENTKRCHFMALQSSGCEPAVKKNSQLAF